MYKVNRILVTHPPIEISRGAGIKIYTPYHPTPFGVNA